MGIAVLKNVVFSLFTPPRPGRPFQAENIEKLILDGIPQTVVIGSRKVGSGQYVITEIGEEWERILNRGEVARITCDLTLEEYV